MSFLGTPPREFWPVDGGITSAQIIGLLRWRADRLSDAIATHEKMITEGRFSGAGEVETCRLIIGTDQLERLALRWAVAKLTEKKIGDRLAPNRLYRGESLP